MTESFAKDEIFSTYQKLDQKIDAYLEVQKIKFIKQHTNYLEKSDKNREKLRYSSLYLECECSGVFQSRGQGKRKRT